MYDFTVIALSGAYPSSVALTLDMLSAAKAIAKQMGTATPRWRVYSTRSDSSLGEHFVFKAKSLTRYRSPDHSIWIVPGLGLDSRASIAERIARPDAQRLAKALAAHARSGGTVAVSCSAVFLLQSAGVLADRTVTTAWWLASQLQRFEPRCTVDANRLVIEDGQVISGGAALAQIDLMLHLLRKCFGAPLADAVSRALLIDARQSKAQLIVPSILANGNELISRLTQLIARIFPKTPNVAALAREVGISERNLTRRVRAATGRSTWALVQSVRVNKARSLIESSRLSVDEIAARVGYSDATALRRLMRKTMGATPRQMRPATIELARPRVRK